MSYVLKTSRPDVVAFIQPVGGDAQHQQLPPDDCQLDSSMCHESLPVRVDIQQPTRCSEARGYQQRVCEAQLVESPEALPAACAAAVRRLRHTGAVKNRNST